MDTVLWSEDVSKCITAADNTIRIMPISVTGPFHTGATSSSSILEVPPSCGEQGSKILQLLFNRQKQYRRLCCHLLVEHNATLCHNKVISVVSKLEGKKTLVYQGIWSGDVCLWTDCGVFEGSCCDGGLSVVTGWRNMTEDQSINQPINQWERATGFRWGWTRDFNW